MTWFDYKCRNIVHVMNCMEDRKVSSRPLTEIQKGVSQDDDRHEAGQRKREEKMNLAAWS